MKGYKVAVGIDKKKGPFPVVIGLEIPVDAIIIAPVDKLHFYDPNYDYRLEMSFNIIPGIPGNGLIQKYRTDKVRVVSMWPLEDFVTEWNHKAYSFFELLHIRSYFVIESPKVIYTAGKEIHEDVLQNQAVSCGPGINYFASIEDAKNYYYNDTTSWAFDLMHGFSRLWCSENVTNFEDNKLKKLLKELSI